MLSQYTAGAVSMTPKLALTAALAPVYPTRPHWGSAGLGSAGLPGVGFEAVGEVAGGRGRAGASVWWMGGLGGQLSYPPNHQTQIAQTTPYVTMQHHSKYTTPPSSGTSNPSTSSASSPAGSSSKPSPPPPPPSYQLPKRSGWASKNISTLPSEEDAPGEQRQDASRDTTEYAATGTARW
ncbi:hypothetical protein V498_04664 [Pseudogymnoascus sp. VKM F-4517 (FW-2822)]|nr:hypothetical protein V498_04664 [Pseudogymnoascus sp. VKM F-4517 (FW-2822)]